jgi:hypothetical protein
MRAIPPSHPRDLLVAIASGFLAEAVLVTAIFSLPVDINGRHPWLELTQMPGAQIALEVGWFRAWFRAYQVAIVFAFLVQAVLFGSLISAGTQVFRFVVSLRNPH